MPVWAGYAVKPNILKTEIEEYKIKLYDETHDLMAMLKGIGFNHVDLHQAFKRHRKPDTTDATIIFECIK